MAEVMEGKWPFPRRKRSSQDRREQKQRAQARVTGKLLSGFASLYHRGSCNTSLAVALEKALVAQGSTSAYTHTSPEDDARGQTATTQAPRKHSYFCKHYLKGFCKLGEDCLFSHSQGADEGVTKVDSSFSAKVKHFGSSVDVTRVDSSFSAKVKHFGSSIDAEKVVGSTLSAHAPVFEPVSCLKKPSFKSGDSASGQDSLVFSAGVFVPDAAGELREFLGSVPAVVIPEPESAEVCAQLKADTSTPAFASEKTDTSSPAVVSDEVVTLHFSNMSNVITVVANVHRPLRDALGVACAGFGMDPLAVQARNIDMEVLRVHRTPRQISLAPEAQIMVVPFVVDVQERDADDFCIVSPQVAAGSRRRISAKSSEVATSDPYSARKSTPIPSPASTPRDSGAESSSEPESATGLVEEPVDVSGALGIGSKVRVRDRATEHWKQGKVVSLLPTKVALVGSKLAFTYAFIVVDKQG